MIRPAIMWAPTFEFRPLSEPLQCVAVRTWRDLGHWIGTCPDGGVYLAGALVALALLRQALSGWRHQRRDQDRRDA
jgi:hypothetical protein